MVYKRENNKNKKRNRDRKILKKEDKLLVRNHKGNDNQMSTV